MYTHNRNYFLIALFTVVLISCSVLNKKNTSHSLTATNSKNFRIVSIDASGKEISNQLILQTLQQNINQLSIYPKVSNSTKITNSPKIISGIDTVIANQNYIKIQYLNGRTLVTGQTQFTKATANLKVEIKKNNTSRFKTITIFPPKLLYISTTGSKIASMSTLDTPDNLQKDIEHIFKNINLTMRRPMLVSGELFVSVNNARVFTDFKNKLGLQSNTSTKTKNILHGVFNLKSSFRKETIPLRIKFYKNNNGSKIKYEFDVNYVIKDNGTTTFKRQEIDYLVSIIRNISTLRQVNLPIAKSPSKKTNNVSTRKLSNNNRLKKTITKRTANKPTFKKTTTLTTIKPKQSLDTRKVKKISVEKNIPLQETAKSKSSNLKNIEYIEKMLSSLKEMRPSK